MTTIHISKETHRELGKIKGELMTLNGKDRNFDEVIEKLIECWKAAQKK